MRVRQVLIFVTGRINRPGSKEQVIGDIQVVYVCRVSVAGDLSSELAVESVVRVGSFDDSNANRWLKTKILLYFLLYNELLCRFTRLLSPCLKLPERF